MIAYSPLAQGLLSGRYDRSNRPANRVRAGNPLFLPENLDRASELIGVLREVADAHEATSAQVALAWVIRTRRWSPSRERPALSSSRAMSRRPRSSYPTTSTPR